VTVDRIELVQPLTGPRERWITSAELRFDGGDPRRVELGDASRTPAGQSVDLGGRTFRTLDVVVRGTNTGDLDDYQGVSAVGFAEVRLRDRASGADARPVRVTEVVRMPTDLVRAAGRRSLRHPLVYTMTRDRTVPRPPRYDPELHLLRAFEVPAARSFELRGEVRFNPTVADSALDRLLGLPDAAAGGVTADSSQRLPGDLASRASAAVDGDPATAWQTELNPADGQWLRVVAPQPVTVDRFDLTVFADGRHSTPRELRVATEDGASRTVPVPPVPDGPAENATATVPLAFEPLRGRELTVTVTRTHPRTIVDYFTGNEVAAPVAIAELGVDGVRRASAPTQLSDACRDDLVTLDGAPLPVRLVGTTAAAVRRDPVRLEVCGPAPTLGTGRHELRTSIGGETGVDVDRIVLSSGAGGAAAPVAAVAGGVPGRDRAPRPPRVRVTASGRDRATVRVERADAPFWLVLGQSDNAGWEATVRPDDGAPRDLGGSTLVDGYANGWLVRPGPGGGPLTVELRWAPQRVVNAALAVSAAAFVAALAAVVVTTLRRRRRPRILAPDPGALGPSLGSPVSPASAGTAVLVGVPLVTGTVAAVLVQPWAALVVAPATFAALRWRPARLALASFPAVAVAACGAYVALQQHRHGFAPKFEWPTFFGRVNQLAWLAVVLLAAGAAIEVVERRRSPGPTTVPPTVPPTVSPTGPTTGPPAPNRG
jgi:hypothetical protein